jgi:hypothetical protein
MVAANACATQRQKTEIRETAESHLFLKFQAVGLLTIEIKEKVTLGIGKHNVGFSRPNALCSSRYN